MQKNSADVSLKFNERASYIFYGTMLACASGLINSFLTYFYTDIFLLSAGVIATLFLVARIWDGINDPMMGFVIDRTNTKHGKFRPYILGGVIAASVFGVLMFLAPDLSMTGKVIWAFATYILYGMAQTITTVPYNALPVVMTSNSQARTKLVAVAKMFTTVSSLAIAMVVLPIANLLGNGDQGKGLFYTVAIMFAITLVSGVMVFSNTKERVEPSKKSISLKNALPVLWANKPALIMMVLGFLRQPIFTAALASMIYFAKYNLGNESIYTLMLVVAAVSALLGMLVLPKFTKKFGKKKTYLIYSFVPVIVGIVYYFVGWDNVILCMIFTFMFTFFIVAPDILTRSILFDAMDYGEWKTGIRSEAIIYSLSTATNKISAGLGGAIVVSTMAAFGYVGGQEVQSMSALAGIHFTHIVIPVILTLICGIIMIFYKLTDEEHSRIVKELAQRKQADEKE